MASKVFYPEVGNVLYPVWLFVALNKVTFFTQFGPFSASYRVIIFTPYISYTIRYRLCGMPFTMCRFYVLPLSRKLIHVLGPGKLIVLIDFNKSPVDKLFAVSVKLFPIGIELISVDIHCLIKYKCICRIAFKWLLAILLQLHVGIQNFGLGCKLHPRVALQHGGIQCRGQIGVADLFKILWLELLAFGHKKNSLCLSCQN